MFRVWLQSEGGLLWEDLGIFLGELNVLPQWAKWKTGLKIRGVWREKIGRPFELPAYWYDAYGGWIWAYPLENYKEWVDKALLDAVEKASKGYQKLFLRSKSATWKDLGWVRGESLLLHELDRLVRAVRRRGEKFPSPYRVTTIPALHPFWGCKEMMSVVGRRRERIALFGGAQYVKWLQSEAHNIEVMRYRGAMLPSQICGNN